MDKLEHTLTSGLPIDGARMYVTSADAVNDKYPNAVDLRSNLILGL